MNKPITLVWQEFINNLTNLVNNSNLPAFIIEYALSDVKQEVHKLSLIQSENDKNYYESLQSEND